MENINYAYNNNEFTVFAPTFIDEFDLPNWLYFFSDVQVNFGYNFTKYETKANNSPVHTNVTKMVKMWYYYNLLRITIINKHLEYFLLLYQMDNLVSSLLMLNTTNTEVSFDEV